MAVAGHNEIDAVALPDVIPRVGDNLPRLYSNHPPTPIRCRSTLRPMHLTPSDFRAVGEAMASPRAAASNVAASPRKTLMSSYTRFFEAPDGSPSFNNPHAHRAAKGAFESSHTTYIFGSRPAAGGVSTIPMPPPLDEPNRDVSRVPTNTTPRPLSVSPAPSPRKSYADRVMVQAAVEEQQLLASISARKAENDRQKSTPRRQTNVDIGKMKNLFLRSEEQPGASPRRRIQLW